MLLNHTHLVNMLDNSNYREKYIRRGKLQDANSLFINIFPFTTNLSACAINKNNGVQGIVGEFYRIIKKEQTAPIEDKEKARQKIKAYAEECFSNKEKIDVFLNIAEDILFPNGKLNPINRSFLKYIPLSEVGKFRSGETKYAQYLRSMLLDDISGEEYLNAPTEDLFSILISNAFNDGNRQKKDLDRYYILPFIKRNFTEDFIWLRNQDDKVFSKYIHTFLYYYLVNSFIQTSLHIDASMYDVCSKQESTVPIYYLLDEEKTGTKRKAITEGWQGKLGDKLRNLFGKVQAIDLVNSLLPEAKGLFSDVLDYLNTVYEESDQKGEALNICIALLNEYQSDKVKLLNERQGESIKIDSETDYYKLIDSFKCFLEELILVCCKLQAKEYVRYASNIENLLRIRILKPRGRAGSVLTLDNELLIFLIGMVTKCERCRLDLMYHKLQERGIYFDIESKNQIQKLLSKLNILEKKSDSGEAQYVKITL